MAREEQDREDLLTEATALVERAELSIHQLDEPVVVGFRDGGCASVYFGQDPAYHFDSHNALRRAYVAGLLYKSDAHRLASLDRQRPGGEVQLVRRDLDRTTTDEFLAAMTERLSILGEQLTAGEYRIVGQVPADCDVVARIIDWLAKLPEVIGIAASPRVQ